jgi:hypothetical protein
LLPSLTALYSIQRVGHGGGEMKRTQDDIERHLQVVRAIAAETKREAEECAAATRRLIEHSRFLTSNTELTVKSRHAIARSMQLLSKPRD